MKEWHRTIILLILIALAVALILYSRQVPVETLTT